MDILLWIYTCSGKTWTFYCEFAAIWPKIGHFTRQIQRYQPKIGHFTENLQRFRPKTCILLRFYTVCRQKWASCWDVPTFSIHRPRAKTAASR
jgi:hypothetical protein